MPRTYAVPIVQITGGASGSIAWSPPTDHGPLIVVGIEGLARADLVTGGGVTVDIKCGDRPITNDAVDLSDANGRWASLLLALDDGPAELPAPIVVGRGEVLSVQFATTGGGVLAVRGALRFVCVALVQADRSRAGAAADAVARQLADEGQLWVVQQTITANTPGLATEWRASYPTLWHGAAVTGLEAITNGTYRQSVGGEHLWRGNGAEDGLTQLPATASASPLLWRGDLATDTGEKTVSSLVGGTVGAGSVVSLWVGRVWR
jgi:hypothetical protein